MRAKRSAKFLLILALLGLARQGFGQQNNKLNYVNPFIGTSKSNVPTKWGNNGGTYPGAVAPSGAVQLTPETSLTGNRGYDYADSSIYYFSCFNHLSGFPFGASGRFFIMPVGKQDNFEDGAYSRPFLHRNERAHPGFYSVVFDDDGTLAEATATLRTGLFRFTFKAKQAPRIFIGDTGELLQQSKRSLHFSNGHTVVNLGADVEGIKPVKGGWLLSFPADPNHQQIIGIQLSASSVSFAGAQNNLDKEIGGANFDEVCLQTSREWAKKLAVIEVRDNSEQNKTVFYTALYHSLLIPWVIEDADGQYAGADGKIQQKSGRHQYGGFSPWDTFRSLNPLLTLLYPEKENDVILSMLDVYKQTGHLPTETMTGNHAIAIIVDTYLKGVAGFDKEFAYKAMKSNIMEAPFVQNDMQLYNENGYIPYTRS
ncbi:glycoside hydrolase domain-containing protein, partial [uncultured Mucilaginibacter sp.]|uniref:glycoside hydrolase domain-containing protein n=1 Tax=uncultured Mucilaginibacter sp. TaxID=797541 RepID=UPI0025FEFEDB